MDSFCIRIATYKTFYNFQIQIKGKRHLFSFIISDSEIEAFFILFKNCSSATTLQMRKI